MIKMILSDLDHTLLRQDGTISEYTLDVLAGCRSRGILFGIATARYWIGAEKYINQLKPDIEITTDGTVVHAGDKCIYSCAFSKEDTKFIVESLFEAVPDAEITVADGKTVYWNSKHIAESERLHKAVYTDYSPIPDVMANKIVAALSDGQIAERIAAEAGCRIQCYRNENWYSFLPKDSGKTAAIRSLASSIGIEAGDIAAFGDDDNDIEMLRLCGTGVAVANAVPEVLNAADTVTLSNDEDGVADWIRRNCL